MQQRAIPIGTITEPGIDEGDSVTTTHGYFENGCTVGELQRFEDANAYVHTAGGLVCVPLHDLVLAI